MKTFPVVLEEAKTFGYAPITDEASPEAQLAAAVQLANEAGISRITITQAEHVLEEHEQRGGWSRKRPEDLVAAVCVDLNDELPLGFTVGDNKGSGFGVFCEHSMADHEVDFWAVDLDGFDDEWFTNSDMDQIMSDECDLTLAITHDGYVNELL